MVRVSMSIDASSSAYRAWKCGRPRLVDLVVVHPDQDPVERTDSPRWSMMPRASVDPRQHRAGSAFLVDQGDCDGSGMDT
jgi:hypothetical protein